MKKILFFLLCVLHGCSTYQSKVSPAYEYLSQGQCASALQHLEELARPQGSDQLVYLMDYGSALQICGDYAKSNSIFLKAEKLTEDNDYTSISKSTGATFLNEEFLQYKGDTFEKFFLNISLAINFLQLGDLDSALIEVRKMNQKFTKLTNENKKNFELNSFSKYLSGLIWEIDKKFDDACIDYRDAYFLDSKYRSIALDMLRSCWRAHRKDEFASLSKKISASPEEIKQAKFLPKAELILLFLQGWGPKKFPRPTDHISAHLIPTPSLTQKFKVQLNGQEFFSEEIYNVESAAIQTLENDYAALVARRAAARVAKEILADQIRQKDSALGTAAWLLMVASERADLRHWSLLPKTFHIIRLPINNFEQTKVQISGLTASGELSEQFSDLNISLKAGEKKIQIFRSLK